MSTSRGSIWWSRRRRVGGLMSLAAALALATAYGLFGARGSVATAQNAGPLQGLGSITGTVTAPSAFKAARVYLRNTDKNIMYMVYTSAGAFRAVAMMPGNYELTVKGRGLESAPQKLVVKAGVNPAVKVGMQAADTPDKYPTWVDRSDARTPGGLSLPKTEPMQLGSYDQVYPPGPGRVVLETLCMNCHGENYFSTRPRSGSAWKNGLDHMMGRALAENDKRGLGEGILAGSASNFRFGLQDRKDVLEYLTANFGLAKKPQAVRTDPEMPLDEEQLSKAQYIEYYVLGGAEATGAPSPATSGPVDSENVSSGIAGVRIIMQVQIDQDGNRWGVDRGKPSRLVKLNPRTGEQKAWDLPDPRAGVHDMLMDRNGIIWVLEFARSAEGFADAMGSGSDLTSRLLGFNMKTEKWEFTIDPDPDNVIRSAKKGPLMGGEVDSKGNIYAHWMMTGGLAKYDRATGKATTFRIPTPGAVPYGSAMDPFDNVWVAEWNGGKLGRFNTTTNTWTEFTPPIYPVNLRRGPRSDAEGNIWTGIWAGGNRAAKIAKLDQKTGNWTMWDLPYRGAQPYEASVDKDGNIWFPDTAENRPDRGAANARFNPRTQSFTFYPRPQAVADSTRVAHAADGSVHYTARYGAAKDTSGFGVLFPDKDKITTLAPLPLNGPNMYAFKVGRQPTN